MTVNECKFQQVLEFIYLRSSLNGSNNIEEERNVRIMMGSRAYFSHYFIEGNKDEIVQNT